MIISFCNSVIYSCTFITIGEPIPFSDLIQFDLLDIDINVEINLLDTHTVKITRKDCKVRLRGEKGPHACFYG